VPQLRVKKAKSVTFEAYLIDEEDKKGGSALAPPPFAYRTIRRFAWSGEPDRLSKIDLQWSESRFRQRERVVTGRKQPDMSMDWDWEIYERRIEEDAGRQKRMSQRLSARLTKGRRFCDTCNSWHPKQQECSKRFEHIVDYIEWCLAHVYGQRDSYADAFIAELATDINRAAQYDDCGARIRETYLNHPKLGPYLLADRVCPPCRDDADLTDEQKTLVRDHLPLAAWAARKYAPTNAALRDELQTRAIEELLNLIHLWDPNRGVTFGAFARLRLLGAMRDCVYKRTRELAVEPEKIDYLGRGARKFPPKSKDDAPRSDRRSEMLFELGVRLDKIVAKPVLDDKGFAGFANIDSHAPQAAPRPREQVDDLTARYLAAGGTIKSRKPTMTKELKGAISRLNARQRAVYESRVMTHPPVPRLRLAGELGTRDPTQISRIQRQAERKVAGVLRPKVSPEDGI
jgi:DNA-directed RNA polymerase specialized sigma subunit